MKNEIHVSLRRKNILAQKKIIFYKIHNDQPFVNKFEEFVENPN